MKKIFLMLAVAVAALQMTAANVDLTQAMRTAQNYLVNEFSAGKMMTAAVNPTLVKAEMGNTKLGQPVYYIFNTESTFLIVSGDDRAEEILMVGDAPLDLDKMPDGLVYLLDCYKEQIEFLQTHPGLIVEKPVRQSTSLKAATYGPLLTCNWDQTAPYYNQCKFTATNGTTYQCVTGCPATSASMVMHYWKYPTAPTPTVPGYTFYIDDNSSRKCVVDALPPITFDWANMKNSYGFGYTYTTAQANAVAWLMRYVGQAEKMDYGTEASGILSSEAYKIVDMFKLFGYDSSTTRLVRKYSYSESNWALVIKNEMANSRPVVYLGISQSGGHAFNVDGYRESDNKFHVNFGWGGYGNNWFVMNAFTDPLDGYAYSSSQQAVIGIQPPGGQVTFPVITVEPDTIHFGTTKTGTPVTRTFHVSGQNLLGDITFNPSGNGSFSVTPTTLTAAEVMAGADITVTYNPTTSGSHKANIEVSGGAAETTIVVCEGTAEAVPLLTANPMELNFNTTVGESVTGTFNLKGYNLAGVVYVKVLSPANGFTVDKTNVAKAAATAGADITVTYKPTTAGNHTTRVMLRSKDADTIYVALNGTATVTTYAPVMQPANEAYVTETSFRADWTDQTPASAVTSYTLEYATGGNSQTVTGIANKFFTLNNLTAGALYTYKVKALYFDGTESNWSNTQQVTLLQQPTFTPGDVNNDGSINITDVTALIDYLLNPSEDTDTQAADVNGDGTVNITDVTALIDMLLSGN